jgi:MYXO-CTERM domain-containing protein
MEVPTNDPTQFDQMSLTAAPSSCTGGVLGASAVSTSWGSSESAGDNDAYFSCPSILTLVSAGDAGYMNEDDMGPATADWPATSPHVLAVGGTVLSPFEEAVWDDDGSAGGGSSTSGCSSLFPMPSYQSSSGFHFGNCKMRAANDVAAAAEWNGGGGGAIAAYNYDSGGWAAYIGTSASSPLLAAILVRLGFGGKDQHTLFYANGGAFNDILTGNNDSKGVCASAAKPLCTAEKEWDGPTGLGSPNGTLLYALAGGTLEPEPDAGPPDSGPPADAGVDTGGGGMDSGKDSGHDGGHKPSKQPIGAPCTGSFECAGSSSSCVAPPSGNGDVCAPPCGGGAPACPSGYSCQMGYCFKGGSPKPEAGTGNPPPKTSSGCACTTATSRSSSWAAAGWLTLGLLALKRRRKR